MRRAKVVLLIAVLISVASISISFAALSQNLTISGSASVTLDKWSVRFQNISDGVLQGSAVENTAPVINSLSTNISEFDIDFLAKDDSISYTIEIVNNGDFDAELELIEFSNPVCTGSGANIIADQLLVCQNINYELTYVDNSAVNINDELLIGQMKEMVIKISYVGDTLPLSSVDIGNIGMKLTYIQK